MPLRHPFEARIIEIRNRVRPEPFDWYTWDSFANLSALDALMPGGIAKAAELAADEPLADIGAGDGDISFLLESLGCQVTAMDWPGTNANRMLGLSLMKRELASSIGIREIDLDGRFDLEGERFGLVLALGFLYHLKNPYLFVERLASHARYCILSTAILSANKKRDPIAYLSGDREFHNDSTNYWFFSDTGLLRLFDRCGWDVTHRYITGRKRDRMFCMAESRIAKTKQTIRLLDGWHEVENNAWRWTKRTFEAIIETPVPARHLEFRFRTVRDSPLTVQAAVNGETLPPVEFQTAGDHTYSAPIGQAERRNRIRITLSDAEIVGGRELGVIVTLPSSTVTDDETGLRVLPTP